MSARLFHISDRTGITHFEPRPVAATEQRVSGNVVWAIDEPHLVNYLLPRDCPRVTFSADDHTSAADRARFLDSTAVRRVVAISGDWIIPAHTTPIHLYELPPETFRCIDTHAGHFVSDRAVPLLACRTVYDPLSELIAQSDIEVRIVDDLKALHKAVMASSLSFSSTRLRNLVPSL